MWTKICGIRDVATARQVATLRPSAIGLNFFSRSPRCVSPPIAREIVAALPDGVEPVGLFVNHSVAEIVETSRQCGLTTVQLHGDEPPEFLAELAAAADVRVIRAHRQGDEGLEPLRQYLDHCTQLGVGLFAVLIDARVEGQYGGTGRRAPWPLLREDYDRAHWPPLILAGGLQPGNVAEAIDAVRPWGVDVAGGVETAPGCKDLSAVAAFLQNAAPPVS